MGGHQLCGCLRIPLHLFIFSPVADIYTWFSFSSSITLFLMILVTNSESLMLKSSCWFLDSSSHMLSSHPCLWWCHWEPWTDGFQKAAFLKQDIDDVKARCSQERGSNGVLPPPTAPSISSGWGPGRTARGRGGLPQVCFKVTLSHLL